MDLKMIENERLEVKKKALRGLGVMLLLIVIGCFVLKSGDITVFKFYTALSVMITLLIWFYIEGHIKLYANTYKNTVVTELLNENFTCVQTSYGRSKVKEDILGVLKTLEGDKRYYFN